MVEAALVFPLLFLVLFAIVEFGFAFKDHLSIGHAVREAARAGATFGNDVYANILVLEEVQAIVASIGTSNGLQVEIYNPASAAGDTYTYAPSGDCDWSPCPDPDSLSYIAPSWLPVNRDVSAPFTDRIGVKVTYTHNWLTNFFDDTSDFTKDVDFQIEPQVFDP